MSTHRPKSVEFRAEREETWLELEALVDKLEQRGIRAATAEELAQLPHLYRATLSSLSVARAISLDRNLLAYLEALCARAYVCVYASRRRPRHVIWRFFTRDFPAGVYRLRWHLLVATLLFGLGVVTSTVMVLEEPELFHSFVSQAYAQGRGPETSTEELHAILFDGAQFGAGDLGQFSSFLMTHNSRIGMLCFVLGFAIGVPVIYLLFENGLVIGAFNALYLSRGLGVEMMSWLLPHGITEILAVLLCGAGGLYIGESILFPGEYSRLENLARRGKQAGVVVLGAVGLFMIAGVIEGVFRQTVQDMTVRFGVAGGSAALWLAYLGLWGGRRGREILAEERGDADER